MNKEQKEKSIIKRYNMKFICTLTIHLTAEMAKMDFDKNKNLKKREKKMKIFFLFGLYWIEKSLCDEKEIERGKGQEGTHQFVQIEELHAAMKMTN